MRNTWLLKAECFFGQAIWANGTEFASQKWLRHLQLHSGSFLQQANIHISSLSFTTWRGGKAKSVSHSAGLRLPSEPWQALHTDRKEFSQVCLQLGHLGGHVPALVGKTSICLSTCAQQITRDACAHWILLLLLIFVRSGMRNRCLLNSLQMRGWSHLQLTMKVHRVFSKDQALFKLLLHDLRK
jgi:hypothetical protein